MTSGNPLRAALVPFLFGGAIPSEAPDWNALGKRWWSHVEFLADDALEGRDTGSRGYAKAAEYVEARFRAAGLKPAGTRGYRQPMEFDVEEIDEARSSLELVHGGSAKPLRFGEEAMFYLTAGAEESVDAEAVFVGYGLAVPELGYDDFADQNLKGKIAVLVSGGPAAMPGPIKAHYQWSYERRRALRRVGAVGMVRIANPKSIDLPWSRMAASRFQPKMELRDPGEDAPAGLPVFVYFDTDRAERLFEWSGHRFREVLDAIEHDRPLPHFPLGARIRSRAAIRRSRVTCENVAGVYPGSDPALKDEFVVLTAHLDHVGIGAPVNGDRIYSGAMDNASGSASLIEIANSLKKSGARPRRSILFVAVTGEEKGLLGSQYYAAHPTVKGTMVANLNMDCFNPIFPLKYLEVQGLEESTLGDDVRAVASGSGIRVQSDHEPERNLFIRSDQYSFIRKGVPALMFGLGFLPGSPEEKIMKAWLAERYHAPADDLAQPVDLVAAAQFNAILERLTLRVADADRRPDWKPESFFRRFVR